MMSCSLCCSAYAELICMIELVLCAVQCNPVR